MGRARLTEVAALNVTRAAALGAVLATVHTTLNLRRLRVPPVDPPPVEERVSILLPLRNEAHRVLPCLEALLRQDGLVQAEILILDDGSTDETVEVVTAATAGDPRVRVIAGADLPDGWLGKPYACSQLAGAASGTALVFVDADVVLADGAVAATITLMRTSGLHMVCPYPRQVAETAAERLIQPLLQWSWLTFLPLGFAESSAQPTLVAANGQLLACDAAAYRAAGGHGSVAQAVLEDVELAKTFKRSGFTATVADGTHLATCRMYESWPQVRDGYSKSLWAAFGSPAGAVLMSALLSSLYVLPPAALVSGRGQVRFAGLVGTAAAITGRAMVARRVGGRVWPDSAAHPVSVAALIGLTARSVHQRRRGQLAWKGRAL